MDPTAADGEAFLTTCNRQRQRRDGYLIEVATNGLRHPVYPPVGPKRSVLMRAGSWPSSTSAFAVASTKPVGPQTYTSGCSPGGHETSSRSSRSIRRPYPCQPPGCPRVRVKPL